MLSSMWIIESTHILFIYAKTTQLSQSVRVSIDGFVVKSSKVTTFLSVTNDSLFLGNRYGAKLHRF
ncbi:hypothetical protein XMD579_000624 [Marinobacterium sp. xm-d-579]|nr:hypothetical protein [Marinobacterium sp. xm-d-579]